MGSLGDRQAPGPSVSSRPSGRRLGPGSAVPRRGLRGDAISPGGSKLVHFWFIFPEQRIKVPNSCELGPLAGDVHDNGNIIDGDVCSNACSLLVVEGKNCKAILAVQPGAQSGVFWIDPDGKDGVVPFQTFCDMTTDGGGWTLILNRLVDSDQTGQLAINAAWFAFNNDRSTNWNFDVDLFWTDSTQVVFADKLNDYCSNCTIAQYDSAIRVDRPAGAAYSSACAGLSAMVNVKKLVGVQANMVDTAYQCGLSLGWGNCAGKVCHFGVNWQSTDNDAAGGDNKWNEMHFPSSYSGTKADNPKNVPPGNCRSCGGGLPLVVNDSSTCCKYAPVNDKSRWTIWIR